MSSTLHTRHHRPRPHRRRVWPKSRRAHRRPGVHRDAGDRGGVIGVVELTRQGRQGLHQPSTAGAGNTEFNGTYRADYGPGTDLDDKPVPNAPATTSNWDDALGMRRGRMRRDGDQCQRELPAVEHDIRPNGRKVDRRRPGVIGVRRRGQPGDLGRLHLGAAAGRHVVGDSIRASTNSLCSAKRTLKFTRTGDADPNKVPDPAVMPPRAVSAADGLHGSYRQTTTFAGGNIVPGQVLSAETYCLRTGDRCMSLFHAGGSAVTLVYADEKWTRNEQGTAMCGDGGTAKVTITAEYPMPRRWTIRSRC